MGIMDIDTTDMGITDMATVETDTPTVTAAATVEADDAVVV
jgi:hypothetical protein